MRTDQLVTEVYQAGLSNTLHTITNLFNKCLDTNKIPDKWKEAKLSYLYKKGDTSDVNNYRPINMSSVLYKAFMTILTNRLRAVVELAGLFSHMQSGWRTNRSTHQRLLHLINRIEHAKLTGKHIHVAYIDLKFAYDTVEH